MKSLAHDHIAEREESACLIPSPGLQGPLVTTAGICTVPASLEVLSHLLSLLILTTAQERGSSDYFKM